jgi:hypothetical protein
MSINPYAPPPEQAQAKYGESDWYCTDLRFASYIELWRLSGHLRPFLKLAFLKTLRQPMFSNVAIAPRETRIVFRDDLPADAIAKLDPLQRDAERLGYRFGFYYVLATVGDVFSAVAVMQSADGRIGLAIIYTKVWVGPVKELATFSCLTRLASGQTIVTISKKKDLQTRPQIDCEFLPGRSLAEIHERHVTRIASPPTEVIPFADFDEMFEFVRQQEMDGVRFHAKRGFYVAATPARVEQIRSGFRIPLAPTTQVLKGIELLCLIALGLGAGLTFFPQLGGRFILFRFLFLGVIPVVVMVTSGIYRFVDHILRGAGLK